MFVFFTTLLALLLPVSPLSNTPTRIYLAKMKKFFFCTKLEVELAYQLYQTTNKQLFTMRSFFIESLHDSLRLDFDISEKMEGKLTNGNHET